MENLIVDQNGEGGTFTASKAWAWGVMLFQNPRALFASLAKTGGYGAPALYAFSWLFASGVMDFAVARFRPRHVGLWYEILLLALGPVLSQHRVNISQFISRFNEKTRDQMGVPLPVMVKIYRDGSFDFEVKTPPASYLIKRAAGVEKGSGANKREPAGQITRSQLQDIAKQKMHDLNAVDMQAAMRVIEGTARSCGVRVVD